MTNPEAKRDYDAAVASVANAEKLVRVYDGVHPLDLLGNPYIGEAVEAAYRLLDELNRHLDDVMDRWTPDQCGLDEPVPYVPADREVTS